LTQGTLGGTVLGALPSAAALVLTPFSRESVNEKVHQGRRPRRRARARGRDRRGDGWTLGFSFPAAGQRVTNGWSATFTQSGQAVTAVSLPYNSALGTNAGATIGFNGAYTGANPIPTAFTLNNVACTGTVVPTTGAIPTTATPTPVSDPVPPIVFFTSPPAGASFTAPATIPIAVTAVNGVGTGTVIRVDFFADNTFIGSDPTAPYTYTWTGVSRTPGATVTISLTARAVTDRGVFGNSTPRPITLTTPLAGNHAPTVGLFDPTNRPVVVTPTTLTLYVQSTDADGDIVNRVELYQNGTLFGTQATNGQAVVFSVFVGSPGTYTYIARSYDGRGGVGTSNAITVTAN
jgi:Cellulose binding domain/Bacterial Ig domain